ncbi:MAG: hypothetical protein KAY24_18230 [Candidatus Eisenbacteria sp.]|nr:hypothetical protein [Candidatus Eisenbacteria bacterium]
MKKRQAFAGLLRRGARARKARLVLEGGTRWFGLCLPGLGLLFLLALCLPPAQLWSGLSASVAALWIVATFVVLCLRPLVRPLRTEAYALWLERRSGLPRNELINALQLERNQARWEGDAISRHLVMRSLQGGMDALARLPGPGLHAERSLAPSLGRGLLGLLPLLLLWLLSPVRFVDTASLFLHAGSPSVVPVIELRVEPGDMKVERGGSVQIQATISGRRRPRGAHLEMRGGAAGSRGAWVRADMVREQAREDSQSDRYLFLASALKGDLAYRVSAGWAQSPVYRIRVLERLQALGYRKLYEPPAYTGMPVQREGSSNGDLAGLTGTRVTLEVRHRRPGAAGRLLLTGGEGKRQIGPLRLREKGPELLSASWILEQSGSYLLELWDETEGDRWTSESFRVEVVPDLDPIVRLLSPGEAIELPPDMFVNLIIDCIDDFGLGELALIYGRPGDEPTRMELASLEKQKEARVTFNWDLDKVQLLPGQELHYYLQVFDNDPIRGPKIGETGIFSIRFPSMAEMYARAEEGRDQEVVSLEDALKVQEDLRDDLQKIAQEMLREEQISWEKQQEISDLIERQKDVARKVEHLQQSLEQSRQRMENQNLFSMEMIDKVREIQQLAEQIRGEEFRQHIERMRQALERMDRRELQRAMEQMKITQEEISKALDRTLQMLRQLMAEEKIDRIIQKLKELQARQEEINRQIEMGQKPPEACEKRQAGEELADRQGDEPTDQQGEAPDSLGAESSPAEERASAEEGEGDEETPLTDEEAADLAAQQEAIRQELEKLQKQLEEMMAESSEGLEQLSKALEQMLKDPSQGESLEQMKQALQAMEQKQRQDALKFGRKAKQAMQKMQANLSQLKQEVDWEKQQRLARALYDISNRLIKTSIRQEGLVNQVERKGPREMAVYQQELCDEVSVLSDSLFQVAKETPILTREHLRAVGKALREIQDARDQFEAGRRSRAVSRAGESTQSLNAAVKKMLEAANQAQSNCASSCSSPFNKMQTLTGQQCSLNEQTKMMFGTMQMPRPSMGQGEAMMRMAARQEMIRQGLDEIREELEGSGKLMGNLGKAIQEMEELIRDLRGRHAERRIVERQEKILSRLLNAQRSIRKRDESEERRSRVGLNPGQRISPPGIDTPRSEAELLRRAMLRGSKDPVPAEYRGMVERYMRCLLRGSQ